MSYIHHTDKLVGFVYTTIFILKYVLVMYLFSLIGQQYFVGDHQLVNINTLIQIKASKIRKHVNFVIGVVHHHHRVQSIPLNRGVAQFISLNPFFKYHLLTLLV